MQISEKHRRIKQMKAIISIVALCLFFGCAQTVRYPRYEHWEKSKSISYDELMRDPGKYEREIIVVRAHYFQRDGEGQAFMLGNHHAHPPWARIVFDPRSLEQSNPDSLEEIRDIMHRTHDTMFGSVREIAYEDRRIVASGWLETVFCDEEEIQAGVLETLIRVPCWKYRFVVTCIHVLEKLSPEEIDALWGQDDPMDEDKGY
jgi:hypothetical protein